MINPCKVRPDTGQPCKLLHHDKKNETCLNCDLRIAYCDNLGCFPTMSEPDAITVTGPVITDDRVASLVKESKRMKQHGPCRYRGCTNKAKLKGFCQAHYNRFFYSKLRGKPTGPELRIDGGSNGDGQCV